MRILVKFLSVFFITIIFSINVSTFLWAQEATPTPSASSSKEAVEKKIKELEGKVNDLQSQEKTLSSQIKIIDNQVALSELKIADAEQKIKDLRADIEITKKKISGLSTDIDKTSRAFVSRSIGVYRVGTIDSWQALLSSSNIDNFFTRLKYLKIVQIYDKKNIFMAEQAKVNYSNQQGVLLDKKKEEEALNQKLKIFNEELSKDKNSKKALLSETQGSESKYQKLLAEARAEYEANQGIVAGNGTEVEIGPVNQGDTIASIIQGPSCNSSGTHVHFTVSKDGSTQNPFSYLKAIDNVNDSSDTFNPTGSWEWPISPQIHLNQGYGVTWFVNTYHFYPFHNGIDIDGSSPSVKAVKKGILFQGAYSGRGGCKLRYVKVRHSDDGLDTFYLHVNYSH